MGPVAPLTSAWPAQSQALVQSENTRERSRAFWLSYAVLVLGLTHNWFGVAPVSAQAAQELFLVAWLVVMVMLTLATPRLPVAYTAVFALVDLALLLVFLGVNETSAGLLKAAGYIVFVFAAVGVYLYAAAASVAAGGGAFPLGRPTVRG